MKKFKMLGLLLAFCLSTTAQQLSEKAFASLITCGPGSDFYTSFGHTALRICDSAQSADIVFNYGTFDFSTPHFYAKFAKGILQYRLSISDYASFMSEYAYEGRSVYEQRLMLSREELEKLLSALQTNYLPENRYYAYDFFLDNCATRVRDQIENALIHRKFYPQNIEKENQTYRQLLHPAMDGHLEWWKFGIDIVLGARCDHKVRTFQYMFLPFHLKEQTDTNCIQGSKLPIAEAPQLLLPRTREQQDTLLLPVYVFWFLLLLFLVLTIIERKKKTCSRIGKTADICLYGATSVLSLLIAFLWFFTAHYCTKWNFNLLWANPLFIWMLIRLKKPGKLVPLLLLACCVLSLIIFIARWPQYFHPAVLPIVLTLILRICSGTQKQS